MMLTVRTVYGGRDAGGADVYWLRPNKLLGPEELVAMEWCGWWVDEDCVEHWNEP